LANGKIAPYVFEKQTGYPHGRPRNFVDHTKLLAYGGTEVQSNMQWQTVAEAKPRTKPSV
jgi:hypothetical protein